MAHDVFIIPSQGIIQFSASDGDGTGKIQASGDNLVISNTVGDVLLGDGASDVFIGDGTNNVDIIFEQNGEIKDDGSGKNLIFGSKTTNVFISGSNTVALQSGGGNVGIGTTTAGAELEVVGNISGSSTSTGSFGKVTIGRGTPKAKQIQLSVDGGVAGTDMARFTRTLGGTGHVAINCNSSMPQIKFFEDSGDKLSSIGISNLSTERANLIFATGSSIAKKQAMVIENATGNVIVTGSGNLIVKNTISASSIRARTDGSSLFLVAADGSGMRVADNGLVGIGNTGDVPPKTLTVAGDISASQDIYLQPGRAINFADGTATRIRETNSHLELSGDEDVILAPDDDVEIQEGDTVYARFKGGERRLEIAGDISASQGFLIGPSKFISSSVGHNAIKFGSNNLNFFDNSGIFEFTNYDDIVADGDAYLRLQFSNNDVGGDTAAEITFVATENHAQAADGTKIEFKAYSNAVDQSESPISTLLTLDPDVGATFSGSINAPKHISASGNISASLTSTGSFGRVEAAGFISAEHIHSTDDMTVADDLTVNGDLEVAGSAAKMIVNMSAVGTVDSIIQFQKAGANQFTIGSDNEASPLFRINSGGTIVGTTDFAMDTSGNVTIQGELAASSVSASGNIVGNEITASGVVTAKQYQNYIMNFDLDPSTLEYYLDWQNDIPQRFIMTEATSFLVPCNTNVRHILMRGTGFDQNLSSTQTIVWKVKTHSPLHGGGNTYASVGNWTTQEQTTVSIGSGTDTTANKLIYAKFSGSHAQGGDFLAISFDFGADYANGADEFFVTVVLEHDYNTLPFLAASDGTMVTGSDAFGTNP